MFQNTVRPQSEHAISAVPGKLSTASHYTAQITFPECSSAVFWATYNFVWSDVCFVPHGRNHSYLRVKLGHGTAIFALRAHLCYIPYSLSCSSRPEKRCIGNKIYTVYRAARFHMHSTNLRAYRCAVLFRRWILLGSRRQFGWKLVCSFCSTAISKYLTSDDISKARNELHLLFLKAALNRIRLYLWFRRRWCKNLCALLGPR